MYTLCKVLTILESKRLIYIYILVKCWSKLGVVRVTICSSNKPEWNDNKVSQFCVMGFPLFIGKETPPLLVCLETELDDTESSSSNVYLSMRLTGINGLGFQWFTTLMQNSCQAREQEQDTLTDITNGRIRTIPHRPYTVCHSSLKESKDGTSRHGKYNPLYLLRHGHLGKLFVSKRTLKLALPE